MASTTPGRARDDPTSVACDTLLVIDAQASLLDGEDAVPAADEVVGTLRGLVHRARSSGAAVVYLQNDGAPGSADVPGSPGWQLDPRVAPEPGEPIVRKATDDGFRDTSLPDVLEHAGSRVLALTGLLSEMCVSATARAALERGYRVVMVTDGHATYDLEDIPARTVARVAEHALGDQVELWPSIAVRFGPPTADSRRAR